jgi:hypothetical protein
MTKLYEINRTKFGVDEYVVIRLRDERRVFYGTRTECREWIERNGHDDSD